MQQDEAVYTVYDLIPSMVNRDPAEVLCKYAVEHNLAPAQLERLGHVFNTASTNSTLSKDRNGTPYLVDVRKMAADFLTETGTAKARYSFLDGPQEIVLDKAAAAAPTAPADLPDFWSGRIPAPSATGKLPKQAAPLHQIVWRALEIAPQALELQTEHAADYAQTTRKIAAELSKSDDSGLKLATLRADAGALLSAPPALLDAVFEKIAAYGTFETAEAKPFVLARDRTTLVPAVEQAIEHLKQAHLADACLAEALIRIHEIAPAHAVQDPRLARAIRKTANEMARLGEAAGLFKSAEPARSTAGPWPSPTAGGGDSYEKPTERAVEDLAIGLLEYGSVAGNLARTIPVAGYGALRLRGGLGEMLGQDIPNALREFTRHGQVGNFLEESAVSNKSRVEGQALDREVIARDTRSMAALQKLMATDELLASKDPEQVFEAFQTIRAAAPEVAADASLLRLMLRNALETQGVDIDSAQAARRFDEMRIPYQAGLRPSPSSK